MDRERWDVLRNSFRSGAAGYEQFRPAYPPAAVEWMLGSARKVADIGAGTGKLTAALVAAGADTVAVEPSADMRDVLSRAVPQARIVDGTGEATTLDDSSVDLATFAQSWHWVDPDQGADEMARILAPHGRVAFVWNHEDTATPWVFAMESVLRPAIEARVELHDPEVGSSLVVLDRRIDRWTRTVTAETLFGALHSRSIYLSAAASEWERMDAAVRGVITDAGLDPNRIDVPYVTGSWIAQPRRP